MEKLFIFNCLLITTNSFPVLNSLAGEDGRTTSGVGASTLLPFLKRFGYLESNTNSTESEPDHESDALYTQESIQEALLEMQKFGDIPQTGELDQETLKLLATPRCGLPDVIRNGEKGSRKKRYVIGANGWNKRLLTYRVENWAPELDESSVLSEVKKAFNTWADYARLRFISKPRWNYDDVDIAISFGRGHHGDRYPFDGSGGVLAHAFFPYGHGSLGGDIHFDVDEKWRSSDENSTDSSAVSFFAVIVHEIGHSLGLGHSPSRDSVMFPYYQYDDQSSGGGGETAKIRLGYDDIMAMYQLYIQRSIEDFPDPSEEPSTSESPSTTTTTTEAVITSSTRRYPDYTIEQSTTPSYTFPSSRTTKYNYPTQTTPTEKSTTYGYPSSTEFSSTSVSTTVESTSSTATATPFPTFSPSRPRPTTIKPFAEDDNSIPDLCKDGYDTITFIRNEIFVFKAEYMWRFRQMGMRERGYPVKTERLFSMLKGVPRIDAAFENDDGKIYFFSGNEYWTFNEDGRGSERSSPITDFYLPPQLYKIDGAFVWGKNKRTYFFSGNMFWRYNSTLKTMDEGYPKSIDRWRGLPLDGIDSVMKWSDGRTYFFKNNDFWRFDDTIVETEEGFPLSTSSFWFGC